MQRHSLAQITADYAGSTRRTCAAGYARAKRLQEKVRVDHEQLAERYLSPEHAAVLLAPPPEGSAYPPLDRDELARRITHLFNDPELVRFAQERAEQPSHQDTIPRELIARPREEVAARTLRTSLAVTSGRKVESAQANGPFGIIARGRSPEKMRELSA
jgi:hypothetical protein